MDSEPKSERGVAHIPLSELYSLDFEGSEAVLARIADLEPNQQVELAKAYFNDYVGDRSYPDTEKYQGFMRVMALLQGLEHRFTGNPHLSDIQPFVQTAATLDRERLLNYGHYDNEDAFNGGPLSTPEGFTLARIEGLSDSYALSIIKGEHLDVVASLKDEEQEAVAEALYERMYGPNGSQRSEAERQEVLASVQQNFANSTLAAHYSYLVSQLTK